MNPEKEPTTIGLSDGAHQKLQMLKEKGYVRDMTDGYRLAIAVALAHGMSATVGGSKTTIFNVGTLDPERLLYHAIQTLRESNDEPVYRSAERLAEWGVEELAKRAAIGDLSIADLLREADSLMPEDAT